MTHGAPDDEDAVAIAADLARRHGASAVVVNTFAEVPAPVAAPAFAGATMTPQFLEALVDRKETVERSTRALAERAAQRFGVAIQLAPPDDGRGQSALLRELPLIDLAILAQSSVSGELGWISPLGDALIEARAPVYIARDGEAVAGKVAVIAWDGGFEAARAVRAALPLLREASAVAILQSHSRLDTSEGGRADPARLGAWLVARGVATPKLVAVGGGRIGPDLLKAAADLGAALLVAGAYRHSRLREAVFGGVTRAFIEAADGPHLVIAH